MSTPVLFVLAGPNGAGKTTLYERVIGPSVQLEFVNADRIAAARWPGSEQEHAYEAARAAADRRAELIEARTSFIAETVFSHPSKIDLMLAARDAGYEVSLHVVVVPLELALARVANRVEHGGHRVPEHKVRERYERLWPHVRTAIAVADESVVYDNTRADTPLRVVARYLGGHLIGVPQWPRWIPPALIDG